MEKHADIVFTWAAITSSFWAHLLDNPVQAVTVTLSSLYLVVKICREIWLFRRDLRRRLPLAEEADG